MDQNEIREVGTQAQLGDRTVTFRTARKEFSFHRLNDDGKAKASEIADLFSTLLNRLEVFNGIEGREMSIVRTKLEEASFFAKKAMAVRPENQAEVR